MRGNRLKIAALSFAATLTPLSALAEEAGKKAGMPQLDAATFPSQLFWLAVTFAFLFVFFRGKTLPQIEGVQDSRRDHVKSTVTGAEQLRVQADAAKKKYESMLEQGRAESTRLIAEADQVSKDKAARKLWEFQERSAQEIAAMEKRISHASTQALEEMDNLAAGLALEAAQKIAGIKADAAQARAVIAGLNGRKEAV